MERTPATMVLRAEAWLWRAAVGVRLTVARSSCERSSLPVRHSRTRRPLLLAGAVAAPLLALGVVAAAPASAHVVVSSPDAAPGGYGKLVFRVPTESAAAKTVKVAVTLPAQTPFGDVSVQMHPGWTVATTERKLAKPVTTDDGFTLDKAVATVTWTATAGGIRRASSTSSTSRSARSPTRPARS